MDSTIGLTAQNLASIVAEVGFPIAVCWYLLIRLEGKFEQYNERIGAMTEAVNGLRDIIARGLKIA